MPKKARAAALRSALSQRVAEGALKVVDRFAIEAAARRKRSSRRSSASWGAIGKTLLVDHEPTDALVLSGRNIPGLKVVDPTQVNVYDVLDCKTLLVSQEALDEAGGAARAVGP